MKLKKSALIIRTVVMLVLVLVLIPILPLLISDRWDWWQAWVMAAVFILCFIISRILAARRNPGIIEERAHYGQHDNTPVWDKILSPLVAFGSVFILLTAGLDALYGCSARFSLALELFGLVLILSGCLLSSYAFIVNAFFSGTVRIQQERGHIVVSGGPYRWVRHPGYIGGLVSNLGMPLLLDSAWAFIPVVIFGVFFIMRTRLEDRFLQTNLPGYREYAQKVRYRLLPGIW